MTISTRGNGEAVVILMLLFQLWALRSGRTVAAGVIYGLAVHWRVYPAIYALSTALSLLGSAAPGRTLPSRLAPPAKFAAAAGAAFLGLTTRPARTTATTSRPSSTPSTSAGRGGPSS
eukprot:CAMPEP_0177605716 /NCGR_PEP_ID=MMETSP0419_2-20121207/16861_1 /TAXON_ID=582737 /ORGANISM="Tetraselmis sp., Strain GSL018" /LENGTH=117 /DNA_ID=CAMNT_0019099907 /DNA_START=347 /DNA_END=696 /DNA_ORIENTATION=+